MLKTTYNGRPCKACGNTLRYYSAHKCVQCNKKWNVKYRQTSNGKIAQEKYWKSEKGKAARHRFQKTKPQKEKAAAYARWYRTTEKGKLVNQVGQSKCKAKRLAAKGTHTTAQWIALKEFYQYKCLRCGANESNLSRPLEEDHVVPLSKFGTNWITNIQPLCHNCNGMGGKGTNSTDYR